MSDGLVRNLSHGQTLPRYDTNTESLRAQGARPRLVGKLQEKLNATENILKYGHRAFAGPRHDDKALMTGELYQESAVNGVGVMKPIS